MWEADTGQLVCVDIHTRNVGQLEWALEGPELRGVPCRGRVELCPCWAVDSSGGFSSSGHWGGGAEPWWRDHFRP